MKGTAVGKSELQFVPLGHVSLGIEDWVPAMCQLATVSCFPEIPSRTCVVDILISLQTSTGSS